MYRQYPRLKGMHVPGYAQTPDVVALHPGRLQIPMRWRKPRMVFVNSMADTFHPQVPDHFLRWLFQAMLFGAEKGHTFQLLTKRPERALQWWQEHGDDLGGVWPRAVWLGVSVEDQANAQLRLEPLRRIPAPVRFVSAEPLLGPLDLGRWLGDVVLWVGRAAPGRGLCRRNGRWSCWSSATPRASRPSSSSSAAEGVSAAATWR